MVRSNGAVFVVHEVVFDVSPMFVSRLFVRLVSDARLDSVKPASLVAFSGLCEGSSSELLSVKAVGALLGAVLACDVRV